MSDRTPAGGVVAGAVVRLARRIAREQIALGAVAVVLTGSHATGEAHPESDIDLIVLSRTGDDASGLERRGRVLVSIARETPAQARAGLRDPRGVCSRVPGWRDAIILLDPEGVAAKLQARAQAWTWVRIGRAADAWVADEITGFAEEAHKLAIALERHDDTAIAAWRSVLALRLAPIIAVHRRILYGSENRLWSMVNDAMGPAWTRTQMAAFGAPNATPRATARAALRLYALAATEARPLLTPPQRRVVDHAVALGRA